MKRLIKAKQADDRLHKFLTPLSKQYQLKHLDVIFQTDDNPLDISLLVN